MRKPLGEIDAPRARPASHDLLKGRHIRAIPFDDSRDLFEIELSMGVDAEVCVVAHQAKAAPTSRLPQLTGSRQQHPSRDKKQDEGYSGQEAQWRGYHTRRGCRRPESSH